MKQKAGPDYDRMFWSIALKQLPHHSLLVLAYKRNNRRLAARLDKQMRTTFTGSLAPPSSEALQKYAQATRHASLWHGTGRLQYQGDKLVDVFAGISRTGALTPRRDVYSIVLTGKEMESLSATTVRIIARSYADTHGKGAQETNRHGSSLWWVAYYYNLCYFEILAKHGVAMARNRSAFNRASADAQGERTWGKKVHRTAKSVWDTFGYGSDIPGNYPILFGIKDTVETAQLPKSMQKWEVRIIRPVTLRDVSHIEVPEQKVEEVRQILRKYGHQLPVFSLEVGEYIASQQSVMDLLYTPLSQQSGQPWQAT